MCSFYRDGRTGLPIRVHDPAAPLILTLLDLGPRCLPEVLGTGLAIGVSETSGKAAAQKWPWVP